MERRRAKREETRREKKRRGHERRKERTTELTEEKERHAKRRLRPTTGEELSKTSEDSGECHIMSVQDRAEKIKKTVENNSR